MRHINHFKRPLHPFSLRTRMLHGAGIGLFLISIFLFSADGTKPEWGAYWRIKPLLMVPLAGSFAGLLYYYLDSIRYEGGWMKVLGIALGVIAYIVVLWIGTVLGLNGTHWD